MADVCISPLLLLDGSLVSCRKCWQCRENRIRDWVGRCIAESKTSWASSVATLTYGQDLRMGGADHMRAQLLTYSDVQLWLKRLRRQTPGGLRFFVAGEYGSAKGRAHWHAICFWKEAYPPNYRELDRYVHHGEGGRLIWPWGWSYWDNAGEGSIRYVCKYILKSDGNEAQGRYGLSSRPPLGAVYFRALAAEYVKNGLAPQDPFYSFAESKRDGKLVRYRLTGASLYGFLHSFSELWLNEHKGETYPHSDLMAEYVDERDRRERRKAGVPDFDERTFAARWALIEREKSGAWLDAAVSVSAELMNTNPYRIAQGRRDPQAGRQP